MSVTLADSQWLLAGTVAGTAGLGLVVRRRSGPISRLSWLDAAIGGSSTGAVAAALGAGGR